jgi:RHS repeat-associated protein
MISMIRRHRAILFAGLGLISASGFILWVTHKDDTVGQNQQQPVRQQAGAPHHSRSLTPEQQVATESARPCDRTVLTHLDLSRPPSEAELIAAGNLGEPLTPTSPADPAGMADPADRRRREADNLAFGTVIQAWNEHRYDEAFALFEQHIADFPDSPWAAESKLHLGCYCQYKGRLAEAANWFEAILEEVPEHTRMWDKAKLRRSILHLDQGHLEESRQGFTEMYASDPDPRHRTYASYWIREISLFMSRETALRDCGQKALAAVADGLGLSESAKELRGLPAAGPHGFTATELFATALLHGLDPAPVWATGSLPELPTPFVAHYEDNHYVTVESVSGEEVRLYDSRAAGTTTIPTGSFERQWSGFAMLFTDPPELAGISPATNLDGIVGGCCGLPRHPSDLGDDPCSDKNCGLPGWSVNVVNMNFRVKDTPMWWEPPYGPSVEMTLLFNSLDSLNSYTPFGEKWSFSYASWLLVTPGDHVQVKDGDGRLETFSHPGPGSYPLTFTAPPGDLRTLIQTADHAYELEQPDGTVYQYGIPTAMQGQSSVPLLLSIEDRHTNTLDIVHNANGAITTITHSSLPTGSEWTFVYTTVTLPDSTVVSRVDYITDPFNRTCSFQYDEEANLNGQTDMGGVSYSYAYTVKDSMDTIGLEASWPDLAPELFISEITTPKGTTAILTEPSDGDSNTVITSEQSAAGYDIDYPPPGTAMWTNYRITITDPENNPAEYHFDGEHVRTYFRDGEQLDQPPGTSVAPGTASTRYYFDLVSGRGVIKLIYQGGSVVRGYDDFDTGSLKPQKIRDSRGYWTYYQRNAQGRTTQIRLPEDGNTGTTDYAIDVKFKPNGFDIENVKRRLLGVQKTLFEATYYPNRDLHVVTDALGRSLTYTWHSNGLPNTITESPTGDVVAFEYDTNWRPSGLRINSQLVVSTGYDLEGRLRSVLDASGYYVTYDYDDLNRLWREEHPDDSFIERIWECCYVREVRSGRIVGGADRIMDRTIFQHDGRGLPVKVTDTAGRITRLGYDAAGRLETLTDPSNNVTQWKYDSSGQLDKKVYPDLTEDDYTWQYHGFLASHENRRGQTINYLYNSHGQLYDVQAPSIHLIYTFDTWDRIDTIKDTYYSSTAHDIEWDLVGRIKEIDGPWPDDTINWDYDDLLRKVTRTTPGSVVTKTVSDDLGRLATLTDPLGLFTFNYTGQAGKPDSVIHTLGNANGASYAGFDTVFGWHDDTQGRALESITHKRPGGGQIAAHSFEYDSLGRIDAWERQAPLANPSGPTREFEWSVYNDLGSQLSSVIERNLGGALQGSWHYAFDPAGNITSSQVNADTTSAASISLRTHNAQNQIDTLGGGGTALVRGILDEPGAVSVGVGSGSEKPARMLDGDRFECEVSLQTGLNDIVVQAVDGSGNKTSQTFRVDVAQQSQVQFQYDDDGNLLSDGTRSYEWDALSRLKKVTWATGKTTEFKYNGLGQRAERIETNGTTVTHYYYLFDDINLIDRRSGESASTATIDRRYFAQGEQRLSGSTWDNYHYGRDHLGSVREVVKWNGTLVARYDFGPFGQRLTQYQSPAYGGPCDVGFTGHITVPNLVAGGGIVLTQYRAYDPMLGEWLSIDPLGELGGLNLYRYVLNQPVDHMDFLGLIEYGSWQYKLLTGGSGDFIENAANAITGFGDSFTLGLSQGIRKLAGTDDLVDKCSGAYKGGEVAGVVASVATGGAGAARAAGGARNIARYELGSKWLPRLTQRAGRLDRWNRYDQVTKGDIILKSANGNWIKAFAPETIIKPFSRKALATGPTPLAGGVAHAGAQVVVNELREEDCD